MKKDKILESIVQKDIDLFKICLNENPNDQVNDWFKVRDEQKKIIRQLKFQELKQKKVKKKIELIKI